MRQTVRATSPQAKKSKKVNEKTLQQIRRIVQATNRQAGAPIRVLQQMQELFGYLPPEILEAISKEMRIPLSELYGITSFYSFFSMVPKGKYVLQVCLGTSCYVKGGQRILDAMHKDFGLESGGTTPDGKFSLQTVRCLGCCGLSPVMAIKENVHGRVKPSQLKDILTSYR